MTTRNSFSSVDVLLTPAEFNTLSGQDLSRTVCVVFDVLRATSSMVVALGNGAKAVIPVAEIPEALAIRRDNPKVLLAGERNGLRIPASMTGSVSFDLGNSPREFTREAVAGRTIVTTTTNGTRALRACAHARLVLLASFLNLRATAEYLVQRAPARLLLVCGGTHEEAAYEDALCAGALCDLLKANIQEPGVTDSVVMVRKLYAMEKTHLAAALARSRNGSRLLSNRHLREDVSFCAQRDVLNVVARMEKSGRVTRVRTAR
jgi:2-phosphosulfolactate phosphatase